MGALACKTKIILDGSRAEGLLAGLCEAAANLSDEQLVALTDEGAYPIIKEIIKAEHALENAHNLLLNAVGYDGPRP